MELLDIRTLKKTTPAGGRREARVRGQIEALGQKTTQSQKPYYELVLADAQSKLSLKAWQDSPAFAGCSGLRVQDFVEVSGEFSLSPYGLESKNWQARGLTDEERAELLIGLPAVREKQARDFAEIEQFVASFNDPRLTTLARNFLTEFGERFRRAAAARNNHHARRGGLVEHTAQMMRAGQALCGAYPQLNRDLLLAGVLFHDCGKLWENQLPEDGFAMPHHELGELLGHITIGIEVVNRLWNALPIEEWKALEPRSEDVRQHLLHLIAAHHGELSFGSPVVPKTPEALTLHHLDNIDARLEMFTQGYAGNAHLAPRIQERAWPLPGNLLTPLPVFSSPAPPPESDSSSPP